MATAVLAGVRPARDVECFLDAAWRLVLENHPHDSIGGCSIDHVHEEMPARTLRARSICHGLVEDLRIALGLGDVTVVHDGVGLGGIGERGDGSPVALRPGTPGQLEAIDSLVLDEPVHVTADAVRAGELEARIVGADAAPAGPWLEVDEVRLDWVDDADAGDEYDFGAVAGEATLVARLDRWSTRRAGPGVAELEVVHVLDLPEGLADDRAARSSTTVRHEVSSRVRVSHASSLANLVVEFDNRVNDHRLRLRATPLDQARADSRVESLGHFAIVERPARPAAPARPWRQDHPGLDHCLGAVRLLPRTDTGDTGAAVLLAGRGIHEYECRPIGNGYSLELTVLRCIGWLSRADIDGRPGHAGPGLATPGAQCIGRHRIELAVGVGARADFDRARAFLAPPMVLEPFGIEAKLESGARARARDVALVTPEDAASRVARLGLRVGGTGVVPSAIKLADDGSGDLVVRWWAPATTVNARARLELGVPVASVQRARLDESTVGPAPIEAGVVEVGVKPGAITTLRVRVATER